MKDIFQEHSKILNNNIKEDIKKQYNIDVSDNFAYAYRVGIMSAFRYGSKAFFDVIIEAKKNLNTINFSEIEIDILNSDIGEFGLYFGEEVPLDLIMEDSSNYELNEAETFEAEEDTEKAIYQGKNVEVNKPKRNSGSGKKYLVYVKDPKTGNIRKITFGDRKGGLTAKINDPEARKAFSARHNCPEKVKQPGAKLTPGYWSCVLPRYAKLLSLSPGDATGYW